jgi:hypothetical protein
MSQYLSVAALSIDRCFRLLSVVNGHLCKAVEGSEQKDKNASIGRRCNPSTLVTLNGIDRLF